MVAVVSFFAMAGDGSGKTRPRPFVGRVLLRFLTINPTYHGVTKRINLADARAHFSHYIERVEQGETVILCRRNVPVAELRPLKVPRQEPRRAGIDRGMKVPASFFEPLPDELLDAFEGGPETAR